MLMLISALFFSIWLIIGWIYLKNFHHEKIHLPILRLHMYGNVSPSDSKRENELLNNVIFLQRVYKYHNIAGIMGLCWCVIDITALLWLYSYLDKCTLIIGFVWFIGVMLSYKKHECNFNISEMYEWTSCTNRFDTSNQKPLSISITLFGTVNVLTFTTKTQTFCSDLIKQQNIDLFKASLLCANVKCPEEIYTKFIEKLEATK